MLLFNKPPPTEATATTTTATTGIIRVTTTTAFGPASPKRASTIRNLGTVMSYSAPTVSRLPGYSLRRLPLALGVLRDNYQGAKVLIRYYC
jgi:hypothetical protein